MQADIFYKTQGERVVPIVLISQSEWDDGHSKHSSLESNCFAARQFKGKLGDYCFIPNSDGLIEKAFVGSGVGNQDTAMANAALALPPGVYQVQGSIRKEALLAWSLAQYRFDAYKKWDIAPKILKVDNNELDAVLALSKSIFLVRDLINRPANDMGPAELALVVEQLATHHQAEFSQWVGDELLQDNFPAIHAVGRASASAPRLLSLVWGNAKHPKVTLIGKGVCFDSGGLDIKPSSGMRLMKKDMGGAAHVIGLAQWIMMQQLPVHLQVLIPAVENSIGPNAFRPGDVLKMRNGLTVEIENTDAEGRLVLADAMAKACEDKPDLMIDFATLTGAARVAVGTEIAAMFSNNDQLAQAMFEVADKVGDPVWRLPLFAPYDELLNSNAADLVNSSPSPYAGAIVAALFLRRFVASTTPWVHFDVMAWNTGNKPGRPEGGEAIGFRAVAEYLLQTYG